MFERIRSVGTVVPLLSAMLLQVALLFAMGTSLATLPRPIGMADAVSRACVCAGQVMPIEAAAR